MDQNIKQKNYVVLSLSGGLDSSTLLLRCLKEYKSITCISFFYGQKHSVELERAQSLVDYLNSKCNEDNCYGGCKITYRQIQLNGLSELLNSSLVTGGEDVPEGHYESSNMSQTVVENRNKIFSSIIQAVALSIAKKNQTTCDIALGIHAGDHFIYKDCREEFRNADYQAFLEGNDQGELVTYYTPYLKVNKFDILKDGETLCEELGLDFDEVYKRTNTSYKPYPSGNSDYKSASSVERVEAFIKLGRPDPIIYEDEDGIASWDKVVAHVNNILNQHNK